VGVGFSGVRFTRAWMKALISASERVSPSRLCWMMSMGWRVTGLIVCGGVGEGADFPPQTMELSEMGHPTDNGKDGRRFPSGMTNLG